VPQSVASSLASALTVEYASTAVVAAAAAATAAVSSSHSSSSSYNISNSAAATGAPRSSRTPRLVSARSETVAASVESSSNGVTPRPAPVSVAEESPFVAFDFRFNLSVSYHSVRSIYIVLFFSVQYSPLCLFSVYLSI